MATSTSNELRQLDQVDYRSGVHRMLLTGALAGCFVIAFLANFPLENRIQRIVKAELAKLPGCNPSFEGLTFGFLMPKVLLTDVQVPASCFGKDGNPMLMRSLTLNFMGPSFSPLGVAFKVSGDINGQPLDIRYSTGFSTQVIKIDEESLNLAKLSTAMPGIPRVDGRLNLGLRLQMAGQQIEDIQILAESKDFVIPPQAMGDFRLPRLAVGDFSVKAASDGPRKIKVQQLVIGKQEAPIRAKFTGTIDVDPSGMANSAVDLTGEAGFSQEFIDSFAILNLMLAQFTQKDGLYQIRLGGTLGQMLPQPL